MLILKQDSFLQVSFLPGCIQLYQRLSITLISVLIVFGCTHGSTWSENYMTQSWNDFTVGRKQLLPSFQVWECTLKYHIGHNQPLLKWMRSCQLNRLHSVRFKFILYFAHIVQSLRYS